MRRGSGFVAVVTHFGSEKNRYLRQLPPPK
nr:MAG TPA: hypothetical protein [Bacteriophage sp.]